MGLYVDGVPVTSPSMSHEDAVAVSILQRYQLVRPVRGQYGRCVVLTLAGAAGVWFIRPYTEYLAVSYTHLTLPTIYSV